MAIVSETQSAATAQSASSAISSNGEVSQLFTTLLVAQIKNQNPLEPQDPSEFVGQMTQLSQMEALQALVSQASTNAAMLESMQVMALGGQVGADVSIATDRIEVGSEPIAGRFTLDTSSTDVALVIRSSSGQQRRIELGTRSAGDVPFTIDPETLGLAPGSYSVRAETGSGAAPIVEVDGTLSTVRMSPTEGIVLSVTNIGSVAPSAITAFNGRH